MQYVDTHVHITELGWKDIEFMALGGLGMAISPIGRLDVNLRSRGDSFDLDAVRTYWDHTLWFGERLYKTFGIRVRHALCFGSNSRLKDLDSLLSSLSCYLGREDVVAVGELGLDPYQWKTTLSERESAELIRVQLELAVPKKIPVVLHTPMVKLERHYIEGPRLPDNTAEPRKLAYAKRSLDIARAANVPDEQIIVDHADEEVIEYVLAHTNSWVAISGANYWRNISPLLAAEWVMRFGVDRLMLNTDAHRHFPFDPLWVPKVLKELWRLGMPDDQIAKVGRENAERVFGVLAESAT